MSNWKQVVLVNRRLDPEGDYSDAPGNHLYIEDGHLRAGDPIPMTGRYYADEYGIHEEAPASGGEAVASSQYHDDANPLYNFAVWCFTPNEIGSWIALTVLFAAVLFVWWLTSDPSYIR